MTEDVRVTIELYGAETMTASGPADQMREAVARRLRALGLAEGPSVVVQDAQLYGPRAVAALYRAGENHTTAEPVGRVTAVRLAAHGGDGDGTAAAPDGNTPQGDESAWGLNNCTEG